MNWRSVAPGRLDLLVAAGFVVVAQSEVWLRWSDGGVGEPLRGAQWAQAVLLAAVAASLAWRRRAPLAAVTVAGVSLSVLALAVTPTAPFLAGLLPLLLLSFSVAAHGGSDRSLIGLGVVLATVGVLTGRIAAMRSGGEIAFGIVAVLGTWSLGRLVARRQRLAEGLATRAAELEVDRERARTALVEERGRIARELHDVIAHSVSLMGVQAGAARVMLEADPDGARESLLSIEATAREAVDEMRRLLGLLRTSPEETARSPQPGLADVPALIDQVRSTGLQVGLAVHGQPKPLPPGADLAAYRIIQEALTNTLKHATARETRVTIRHTRSQVELEVVDDGRGVNGHCTPGHGLVGMRERAELYGGEFAAGPRAGGGYAVQARLPRHP